MIGHQEKVRQFGQFTQSMSASNAVVAGETRLSVVASEGFSLAPERYLGLRADEDVQNAKESERRAKKRLSLARKRLAAAKRARKKSQKLIDSGKVRLLP